MNILQQEEIILEVYERPSKEYLQASPELHTQVASKNLVQRYLPKQADFDIILKIIQRNALNRAHLPVMVMEIQVEYLNSSYSQYIYLYLVHNKLPLHEPAIKKT